MGQKQNKSRDNNLTIEINPINNLTYEISLINNSKNYKALISESFMKDMLQIKNKSSLIQHIKENNEISYKKYLSFFIYIFSSDPTVLYYIKLLNTNFNYMILMITNVFHI